MPSDTTISSGIDRITIIPGLCGGKPTIRGLRITVETILGYIAAGDTPEDILAAFPLLEAEDLAACLAFASRLASRRYDVVHIG